MISSDFMGGICFGVALAILTRLVTDASKWFIRAKWKNRMAILAREVKDMEEKFNAN